MEEKIKSELRPGEEILWSGKAEAFKLADETHKRSLVLKALTPLIAALATWAGLYFGTKQSSSSHLVLILIVLLLFVIPFGNAISDASKLHNMYYFATTSRLISYQDHFISVNYSAVKEAKMAEDADGHISLVCGKEAMRAKPTKWREICVVGPASSDDPNHCLRFVMYAVYDPDALRAAVKDKLHL